MLGVQYLAVDVGGYVTCDRVDDDGDGVVLSGAVGGVGSSTVAFAGLEGLVDVGLDAVAGGDALGGFLHILLHECEDIEIEGSDGTGGCEGFFFGFRVFLLEEGLVGVLGLALGIPVVVTGGTGTPAVEETGEAVAGCR